MFALLVLLASHSARGAAALYADPAHRELRFVPAAMIQRHAPAARAALAQIAQVENPAGLDCLPPPQFDAFAPMPPRFADYLREGPEVLAATVTEPGVSARARRTRSRARATNFSYTV